MLLMQFNGPLSSVIKCTECSAIHYTGGTRWLCSLGCFSNVDKILSRSRAARGCCAAYAVMRCMCVCLFVCLSVRPSVTFAYSVETTKLVFKLFHRRIATPFWFSIPNVMAIFRREPPNSGVECRWGTQKSRFSTNIWLSDR